MKKYIYGIGLVIGLIGLGCNTAKLQEGGVYAPTNAVGQVIYNDLGLALADATYKLTYTAILDIFKFERDNRKIIWDLSPEVKKSLDIARPQVVAINRRWAASRKVYRQNPTPSGLNDLQLIMAEINRILPVVQANIEPVKNKIVIK